MAIPNLWRGLRGLPADLWLLFATTLVNRTGRMALAFLVLYLTQQNGAVGADRGGGTDRVRAYTVSFGLAFTVGPRAGTVVLDRAGAVVLWSLMLVLGVAAAVAAG